MDTKGRFIDWRFSAAELIAGMLSLTSIAVGITLWSVSTFQSKDDAIEVKMQLERRMDSLEGQVNTMRLSLEGVARDTSWIRGRLEPKGRD